MKMPAKLAAPLPDDLVLIVEDEEPIAQALALIVEEAGYTAMTAAHGRDALALARALRPSLIITDLMMPYLDGAHLIEALGREEHMDGGRHIPVILMTAARGLRLENIKADALVRKPFDMDDIEILLHRYLDN